MRFYQKPARPIRDTIAVYEAIKARSDKKSGKVLIDAREIASQTRLTSGAVVAALEALVEEGIVQNEKSPFTVLPCSYVTLIEDLEPAVSLRERYDA